MRRTRTTIEVARRALGLAAALLCTYAVAAAAASLEDLVGRWYTELQEESTFDGVPYTIRRQIELNRPDGTKTVQFRFYDNCKLVGEVVNEFDYRVLDGVYMASCTAIVRGSVSYPCGGLQSHDILSVRKDHLSYRNRSTGTLYSHTRVPDDFALPDSACLGALPPRARISTGH